MSTVAEVASPSVKMYCSRVLGEALCVCLRETYVVLCYELGVMLEAKPVPTRVRASSKSMPRCIHFSGCHWIPYVSFLSFGIHERVSELTEGGPYVEATSHLIILMSSELNGCCLPTRSNASAV